MSSYYKYSANMSDRAYYTSVVNTTSGAEKRYFSNIESEIYFGNTEIKDIYRFDFQINEQKLPIYGYNCFYASEIVSGVRIIQGQFVLNFTDGAYMKQLLSTINDSVYAPKYKEEYCPGGGKDHALYDKEFDIMIGFGYYGTEEETINATSQTIVGAKISGMEKVLDTTGQPIMEVYSFIAKDFVEETTQKSTPRNDDDDGEKEIPEKEPDADYVCSDFYDEQEVAKNREYCKNHTSTIHLVEILQLTDDTITLNISGDNGEKIKISSGNITITEHYESDTKIPVIKLDNIKGNTCTMKIDSSYVKVLEEIKKSGTEKIKCTLKYDITVDAKKDSFAFSVSNMSSYLHFEGGNNNEDS